MDTPTAAATTSGPRPWERRERARDSVVEVVVDIVIGSFWDREMIGWGRESFRRGYWKGAGAEVDLKKFSEIGSCL